MFEILVQVDPGATVEGGAGGLTLDPCLLTPRHLVDRRVPGTFLPMGQKLEKEAPGGRGRGRGRGKWRGRGGEGGRGSGGDSERGRAQERTLKE